MKAGQLNRLVTFRQRSIAYDDYNEPIETWADAFTVWAAVAEIGSKEVYHAQKLYAETEAVFQVRYTQRINSRMRIKYGNRTFEILGATPDAKRTALNVAAKEVT